MKKIIVDTNLQVMIMKFFLNKSVPRILADKEE